jgi:hypothetical protein
MAITHHFNNENDVAAGGTWFDDYGRRICDWSWDVQKRILTIKTGAVGRTVDLSKHGDQNFTQETLKQRLPEIAIRKAEDITKRKYQD